MSRAPLVEIMRRASWVAKRRNAEANDAYDFRYFGDEDHRHERRCLFLKNGGEACSRDYVMDEPLHDPQMYEGTSIGALYGLPDTDIHAWQLAGWTIRRRPVKVEDQNR